MSKVEKLESLKQEKVLLERRKQKVFIKKNKELTGSIRRLTPLETCRLQGFPDDWNDCQSDTQRYKQMGNAVTVDVVEAIYNKLYNLG